MRPFTEMRNTMQFKIMNSDLRHFHITKAMRHPSGNLGWTIKIDTCASIPLQRELSTEDGFVGVGHRNTF